MVVCTYVFSFHLDCSLGGSEQALSTRYSNYAFCPRLSEVYKMYTSLCTAQWYAEATSTQPKVDNE